MTPSSLLSMLSVDDKWHVFRRLRPILRRTHNEGVLFLVMAVLFATVAAVSLRLLLIESGLAEKQDQELFTKTFGVRQEERELPYPGVVAGLLGTINHAVSDVHCPPNSQLPACVQKDAVLDTVVQLAKLAFDKRLIERAQLFSPGDCGESIDAETRDKLLAIWIGGATDSVRRCSWLRSVLQSVANIRSPRGGTEFVPCPKVGATDPKGGSVHGVGYASCDASWAPGGPASLIPAQLTDLAIAEKINAYLTTRTNVDFGKAPQWETDATEIEPVARLLDAGVTNAMSLVVTSTSAAAPLPKDSLMEGAELRQAYFVSPDNFLRIWTRKGDPIKALPRARLWSNASYIRHFVATGARAPVKTRAYLDVGGNGLVSTECRPLWLGEGEFSIFLGAVCIDITLNILGNKAILKRLSDNTALNIQPVELSMRDAALLIEPLDVASDLFRFDSKALDAAKEREFSALTLDDLAQTVRPLEVGGRSAFLVPVGKNGESAFQGLIVSPAESRGLGSRQTILAIVLSASAFLCLAFVFVGAWEKHADDMIRSDLAIFRSLQTAVIETVIDGEYIVRVNDRAEELLGMELPKSRSDPPADILYSQLFDLAVELDGDRWPDSGNTVRGVPASYRVLTADTIYQRRKEGRTTRYWMRLKGGAPEKAWMFVQAGPLVRELSNEGPWSFRSWRTLFRRRRGKAAGTYGTLDRASNKRIEQLEMFWTREKERMERERTGVRDNVPSQQEKAGQGANPSGTASQRGPGIDAGGID